MAKIVIKNPTEKINYYTKKNIPFILHQTTFTKRIFVQGKEYYYAKKSSGIKKPDLGFIGLVKKHCEKVDFKRTVDRSQINYIQPNINIKTSYKLTRDLWEIDLTGAYWEFANNEGVLSESIYKRGLEIKKNIRLISLGNLAKRTAVIKFDGKEQSPIEFIDSDTKEIFFYVSYLTDMLIKRLAVLIDKDFLFYWCDAVFMKSEEAKNKIIEYLTEEGIKFKVIKINSIYRDKNKITTYDDTHIKTDIDPKTGKEKNPDGKRVFNFRKNNLLIGQLNKKPNAKKAKV